MGLLLIIETEMALVDLKKSLSLYTNGRLLHWVMTGLYHTTGFLKLTTYWKEWGVSKSWLFHAFSSIKKRSGIEVRSSFCTIINNHALPQHTSLLFHESSDNVDTIHILVHSTLFTGFAFLIWRNYNTVVMQSREKLTLRINNGDCTSFCHIYM